MTYVLLILAGILSWFALRNRNFLIGFLSGAAWFVLMAYIATYPPGGLVQGDTIHNMLVLVLAGVALAMPIASFRMSRAKEYNVRAGVVGGEEREPKQLVASIRESHSTRHGVATTMNETPEEYQARIHTMLRKKRSRR